MSIRVIIAGFKGRMGQAACQMVLADPDLDLVAVLDPFESESEWQGIPVFKDKADLAGFEADVWVDFTTPTVAYENTRFALENGFAPVVGTTGFTSEEIAELKAFSREQNLGGLIAPNFALGAVLLMQFATQAAKIISPIHSTEQDMLLRRLGEHCEVHLFPWHQYRQWSCHLDLLLDLVVLLDDCHFQEPSCQHHTSFEPLP